MIESIISFSVRQKAVVFFFLALLIGAGLYSLQTLPVDAVPDITNNQVQVVTVSPTLAPQEVEQFITYPVEIAMANIPNITEIRSISRYGLSVITVVFKDHVPMLEARQFVKEQISVAAEEIPSGLGTPELMPITTGLGEIYQYVLTVEPGYEEEHDAMELRTIQDWIVKRQLSGIPGIIEVSSFGGYLKQYEVALDPNLLNSLDLSIADVFSALEKNNQNSGGSYIEKNKNAFYIRSEGIVKSIEDIENMVIDNKSGIPILVKHVAKVGFGSPKRFGAMTMDGKGETVGGITLMLKGANSSRTIANVKERIAQIEKSLPKGVGIYTYLDRADLVKKTTNTVKKNLLEGGIIVIFVLVLLLGNWRAGIIVASIIPLSMLFALIMMNLFQVSANLMSLGAIDFGIVVDGAVIIVEGFLHTLFTVYVGKKLTGDQMDQIIVSSTARLFQSAVFGVLIILVVFIPIMTLTGIEGKMFRPMAMTFSFAVLGALILSLTYVPAISSLLISKEIVSKVSLADKIMDFFKRIYLPILNVVLTYPRLILAGAFSLLILAVMLFRSLGSVFIPTLEEGDLAMQMAIRPGSSLQESIQTSTKAEKILLEHFPEVKHVVSKIGTAEIPTDPMAIEDADIMIILKPKEEWVSATTRDELADKMKESLEVLSGVSFEFTQPIQLRFNELMTGAKTDIAIKIFGENTAILKDLADKTAELIEDIPGAGDVKVEQTEGLSQLVVKYNRQKLAYYGVHIHDINTIIRTAFAGETAGIVFENERKFDLVLRLKEDSRRELNLNELYIFLTDGNKIPLSEVAEVEYVEGPMQISREDAKRRINIGVNVRNRDVAGLVEDIKTRLDQRLALPPGYTIRYGGEFENLIAAKQRLYLAVPLALLLIFVLLFFAFGSTKYALLIFSAVPLSAIGGIAALWIRDMPFSISAGVGFIALFGVAMLNGIVLISYYNRLTHEDKLSDTKEIIIKGSLDRLRPVLITAIVAALGFIPMALSTSNGAEVQKPLASVVIGGIFTDTILTLLVLPALYFLVNRKKRLAKGLGIIIFFISITGTSSHAQTEHPALQRIIKQVYAQHPLLQQAENVKKFDQLSIAGSRILPPTEFDLQLGQKDTPLFDYNLSINQSLGKPGLDRQKKRGYEMDYQISSIQKDILSKTIVKNIRSAWYEWVYYQQIETLEQRRVALFEELNSKSVIRLQAGQINLLDQTLVSNALAIAEQNLAAAMASKIQALNQFLKVSMLPDLVDVDEVELLPLDFPALTPQINFLNRPNQLQIERASIETDRAKAELFPEWILGYFNQSIQPDFLLQGLFISARVPIWRKYAQSEIQKAQLFEIQSNLEFDIQSKRLSLEKEMATEKAALYKKRLDGQGNLLNQQAQILIDLASKQLEAGQIDYFKYVQALESAILASKEYLNLLHQYNQSVIALEFFIE
jgi:heavy metal efflux system protein